MEGIYKEKGQTGSTKTLRGFQFKKTPQIHKSYLYYFCVNDFIGNENIYIMQRGFCGWEREREREREREILTAKCLTICGSATAFVYNE